MTTNENGTVGENIGWPHECHHYGGNENVMGHTEHKCKHPNNKQPCMPISCPMVKLEKLEKKLETYEEELKDKIGTEEELWYQDEIGWLKDEIQKISEERG